LRRSNAAGLLAAGTASVDVAVTHALIDAPSLAALHAAGVGQFWSTDCVEHPTNTVPMALELVGGEVGVGTMGHDDRLSRPKW